MDDEGYIEEDRVGRTYGKSLTHNAGAETGLTLVQAAGRRGADRRAHSTTHKVRAGRARFTKVGNSQLAPKDPFAVLVEDEKSRLPEPPRYSAHTCLPVNGSHRSMGASTRSAARGEACSHLSRSALTARILPVIVDKPSVLFESSIDLQL